MAFIKFIGGVRLRLGGTPGSGQTFGHSSANPSTAAQNGDGGNSGDSIYNYFIVGFGPGFEGDWQS